MGSNGLLVLPGDDWAVVKLGHRGIVNSVLIDTNHFKGNFPESCQVEGCLYEGSDVATLNSKGEFPGAAWMPLVTRCKLAAHEEVEKESICTTPITHLRLTIYPDGGVSRLRAYGVPC
ncbi:hypothetical protein SARC_04800 [Sphaeroforma arctica JP610]|uniref:Allantoicase domain-containing protein n=1 Tax=Sphaeroforma arctica JP610 TaxID=667725 RepID=A0A0L0G3Y0_9EUKA|nr:hypothetical protein SARC_04800 [Sphaeroforma arctica JP610]KNC82933.1 hypothetical protein SARC_04800 [Sphaeroforma arctica JP610]|eukprot:XP_014156835.1 hypothetical protein SARC_04800 [Sphaeroforma arctica JP610]